MSNAVVHFEFATADPEALAKFYSDLFGWNTQNFSADYVLVDTASGGGINGGIMKAADNFETIYIEVPDLQKALDKIEKLGGKTVVPPTEQPMVTFAHFSDPAGNKVGLIQSREGEAPGPSKGKNPPVDWFELLGKDGKGLAKFYKDAFGWELEDTGAEGFDYFMMQKPKEGSPGAVGSPPDGNSAVRFYAGTEDVENVLKKAESLGAKTVMEPSQVAENTTVAIFVDPQGHTFGLYRGL
jgi:predicted enzyme related to lactoylglutathione lyase